MHCPKFIMDAITEPDNKTVCPLRLVAIAGCAQYFGMSLAHYVQHSVFEPQAFALGFGAILASAGVALGIKKDSPKE